VTLAGRAWAIHKWHQGIRFSGTLVLTLVFLLSTLPCPVLGNPQAKRLDLSSTTPSVKAPRAGQIEVGGTAKTVERGQLLTPAEFMALRQTRGGQQLLELNDAGAAIGGQVRLGGNATLLKSFYLPQDVTAIVSSRSGRQDIPQGSLVVRGL